MAPLRLITWNVLHRYHEINYVPDSTVLKAHPTESVRLNGQVQVIAKMLASHENTIICLQEVPGDLLSMLKNNFGDRFHIMEYIHNRIPSIRDAINATANNVYRKPAEYLCTLIPKKIYPQVQVKVTQYETTGKAALITKCNADLIIINTHATIDTQGVNDVVNVYANDLTGLIDSNTKVFILGDFNNKLSYVLNGFESKGLKLDYFFDHEYIFESNGLYSYPRGNKSIDHILGFGSDLADAVVSFGIIDTESLSDHLAVELTIS